MLPRLELRVVVVRPTEVEQVVKLLGRPLCVGKGATEEVVLGGALGCLTRQQFKVVDVDDALRIEHFLVELRHKVVEDHLQDVGLALVGGFSAAVVHVIDELFECLPLVV